MKKSSLQKGINLGGWLSQFKHDDHNHFRTFIQEDDIKRIAEWGFDHIRLPVDYPILENDSHPGKYLESGFDYVFTCFDWCKNADLRVILDLHKAPGYAFDNQQANQLEQNTEMQIRFINLWSAITKEFISIDHDLLAFELLNEINFESSEIWNEIIEKTLQTIRPLDSDRLILIGGNYYSSVDYLSNIRIFNDKKILYKFHFFLPLSVTHQKAYWLKGLYEFNRQVDYPGTASGLKPFLENNPEYQKRLAEDADIYFDRSYLLQRLKPAIDFAKKIGQPIHCGEFGVIDRAPRKTRENWTRDIVSLFKEYKIGYAYWSYKAMDFGLVDYAGNVINQELINILVR
jgi:hypothetical protein